MEHSEPRLMVATNAFGLGVDKVDFELVSLAVSAVNGCGMCVNAHDAVLKKHGTGRESIQSAVRIASVIHAVAQVLAYERAA